MLTKYQPRFADLSPDQVSLLASALRMDLPEPTGTALYAACELAGHSQATVVLALATDRSVRACRTIETLIGRPIEIGHPCLSGPDPRRSGNPETRTPTKTGQRARTAPLPKSDPRVVVAVTPNPKRAGSASAVRYEAWIVGRTVNECLAAGLTPGDVRWDEDRGHVTLALPDSPEAVAVRPNGDAS